MKVPLLRVSVVREGSAQVDVLVDSPRQVWGIVRGLVGSDEREHFYVFHLDAHKRVRGIQLVSIGTLTASLVHPREVFRAAIINGAAEIIVAHNHPSGDQTPSPEDRETTRRLKQVGKLIGIPLIDHVIVAGERYMSFHEGALL